MSRRFSKVEEISLLKSTVISPPFFSIIGAVIALAAIFFLVSLYFNMAALKNDIFSSMDEKIQQQQIQIMLLTKKLDVLQSSMDNSDQKEEAAIKNMINSFGQKIDGLNHSVKSKLDQTSKNMDQMEAVLQANIDALNTELKKLQIYLPDTPKPQDPVTLDTTN